MEQQSEASSATPARQTRQMHSYTAASDRGKSIVKTQRKSPGQSGLPVLRQTRQAPDRLPSKDPSQYSGWMKRSAVPAEFLIHRWK